MVHRHVPVVYSKSGLAVPQAGHHQVIEAPTHKPPFQSLDTGRPGSFAHMMNLPEPISAERATLDCPSETGSTLALAKRKS